jgi:D-proline reductase (dithiol) PrdB
MALEPSKSSKKIEPDVLKTKSEWQIKEPAGLTRLIKPVSQCLVGYITICGLYRIDQQIPFDAFNAIGDSSFREIHIDTPKDRIGIAHSHYDHKHADEDLNVVWPVEQMKLFEEKGTIGHLYPWFYSFMGFIPQSHQLEKESAPVLADRLIGDGVNAMILTPC